MANCERNRVNLREVGGGQAGGADETGIWNVLIIPASCVDLIKPRLWVGGRVSKNSEAGWGQDRVKLLPHAASVEGGGSKGARWAGWREERWEGEVHFLARL